MNHEMKRAAVKMHADTQYDDVVPHVSDRSAREVRYLAEHFGFYAVQVKHVANKPRYTERSDTRQTGRLKATNRSAKDIRFEKKSRSGDICYTGSCTDMHTRATD